MTKTQKQQWQAKLEQLNKQAERNYLEGKKDWRLDQQIKLAQAKLGM